MHGDTWLSFHILNEVVNKEWFGGNVILYIIVQKIFTPISLGMAWIYFFGQSWGWNALSLPNDFGLGHVISLGQ